jgi:hypothetical protein
VPLVVLLFSGGLPTDVIVFGNDRMKLPLEYLATLGISHPMMVIMHDSAWDRLEPADGSKPTIRLQQKSPNTVRRVVSTAGDMSEEKCLNYLYNQAAYRKLSSLSAKAVTHHDDLPALLNSRRSAGINPFAALLTLLSIGARDGCFHVTVDEADFTRLTVAKLAHRFATHYQRDAQRFINHATLAECNA